MIKFWKNIKKDRKITVHTLNFPLKALIAPLDWGLGHTTRCIPIIRYLQQNNCQIFIAANSVQTLILQKELHGVNYLSLRGYNIKYPKKGNVFALKIILQLPNILFSVFNENQWIRKKQQEHNFDIIISDNRYGLFNPTTHTIFITHQLKIRSGVSEKTDRLINRWNHRFINNFNECWVPDLIEPFQLAGELSHSSATLSNLKYIGPLSRFHPGQRKQDIRLLVILSGPEPQRTLFEKIILSQIQKVNQPVVIIRGLPDEIENPLPELSGVTIISHLPTPEFEIMLQRAEMVLCRAGYSSIMDLVMMGKKALLVPTPGQGEQEYLAEYLYKKGIFFSVKQDRLNLCQHINEAERFIYHPISISFEGYKNAIDELMNTLKNKQ